MNTKSFAQTFTLGCVAYPVLEITYRGYSHWSMALTGGLCLAFLFLIQSRLYLLPLWKRALLGALVITTIELTVGIPVNLWFQWDVWDYTDLRFHYMGQISLLFTAGWYLLSILVLGIADLVAMLQAKTPELQ